MFEVNRFTGSLGTSALKFDRSGQAESIETQEPAPDVIRVEAIPRTV